MKSHTTRLIDKEKDLAVTRAQKKAVAQARRVAMGIARRSMRDAYAWARIGCIGRTANADTSVDIHLSRHDKRVDKFPPETAKEFAWRPIERNGEPITFAEATQGWDAAARDKIQRAVDCYEKMQKERRDKRQARRSIGSAFPVGVQAASS